MSTEITPFAKTAFRGQEQVFGIKRDDRRRHVYIIGKTGMGKTTLLEHFVAHDIAAGHGVAYIDPHGDTAEKMLSLIPPHRQDDVIYFNPADMSYPVAFNVLEHVDPEYRHLVASGIVGVFKKLWADSWGPRLEYILRNAIMALLETPNTTLLGVMRILVDKRYRKRIVGAVSDPVVRAFWTEEFPKWQGPVLQEVIAPIQNKVGQFLTSALIRNIVGQPQSAFSLRDVMDKKKILIVNLAKGRIGEDNSALLGAMMVTKIQMAAMSRVDMPEEKRNDFYLYVDEFQNFSTESFATILSEARKYRLNLTLAHQYIAQLDDAVRDAIFGNVGTTISFRIGAADAEFLEKEFAPVFTLNDFVNLPKYHIYLKLMIDGVTADAFSATTLPPVEPGHTSQEENIIANSRARYAVPRETVEERINVWSGYGGSVRNTAVAETKTEASDVDTADDLTEKSSDALKSLPDTPVSSASSDIVKDVSLSSDASEHADETSSSASSKDLSKNSSKDRSAGTVSRDDRSSERVMHDTTCDTCGIDITVPFIPDGRRGVFCKDCLADYRSAMMRAQHHAMQQQRTDGATKQTVVRSVERVVRTVREKPLSLAQMTHVAPKRFSSSSPRSPRDSVTHSDKNHDE